MKQRKLSPEEVKLELVIFKLNVRAVTISKGQFRNCIPAIDIRNTDTRDRTSLKRYFSDMSQPIIIIFQLLTSICQPSLLQNKLFVSLFSAKNSCRLPERSIQPTELRKVPCQVRIIYFDFYFSTLLLFCGSKKIHIVPMRKKSKMYPLAFISISFSSSSDIPGVGAVIVFSSQIDA